MRILIILYYIDYTRRSNLLYFPYEYMFKGVLTKIEAILKRAYSTNISAWHLRNDRYNYINTNVFALWKGNLQTI